MPREVQRQPFVPPPPNWFKTPHMASSENLLPLEAPEHTAICVHSGLDLGSTIMNQKRLRKLILAAEGLETAVDNITDAQWALNERRDEHWRHHSDYGRQFGSESESNDEEDALTARRNQILQTIMTFNRERITKFIKAHTRESCVSIEERLDLDAAGADFDVLEEYLDTEVAHARRRLMHVHKTFVSEFEAGVKAESFPFLTELHSAIRTHLPTELRNMIYAYLLPDEKEMHGHVLYLPLPFFNPDFHVNTDLPGYDEHHSGRLESEAETTRRSFQAGTEDVHKPGGWLLNPSYVGKDMAHDLAEIYYSSYGFGLGMQNMKGFLHDDRTETGFKPVEHIRKKLDIDVQTTLGNGRSEGAWASTNNEAEFLNRIYTNLGDLLLLSHIREIRMTIRISTCSPLGEPLMETNRRFYNVMEAVREPIYDMLHAGVDLEVWHVVFASSKSRVISKEPWNLFRVSKEVWQDERQTHGPPWRPSSNFVTRENCQEDTLQQLLVERWGLTKLIDLYGC